MSPPEGEEPEPYLGITLEISCAQDGRVRVRSVELREGMSHIIDELVTDGFYARGGIEADKRIIGQTC